jgi:hypothetical protein
METVAPAEPSCPRCLATLTDHTGPQTARGLQHSLRIRLHNESKQETAVVIQNHLNSNVHAIRQGEAMRRKYKSFNLGALKPTTVKVSNCHLIVDKEVKA